MAVPFLTVFPEAENGSRYCTGFEKQLNIIILVFTEKDFKKNLYNTF